MPDIWFPYLGIEIEHLSKTAFTIGDYSIAWYGIIIAAGAVLGLLLARLLAKKSGQNADIYTDFVIYALIFGVIGARIYYVAFQWDLYKDNLLSILDIRGGGLAIYGGVIAAIITAIIFCRVKHYNFWELLDTAMPGLALGQAIGRWGNFFNQEAFGCYTDGLFAMRLNVKTAAYTTTELTKAGISKGGVTYIQVHPTFFYESVGCLLILAIMLIVFKHRKFKGATAITYMIGYGLLRAYIETLRTDQLLVWNTNWPISVFVSIAFVILGIVLFLVLNHKARLAAGKVRKRKKKNKKSYAPDLEESEEDLSAGESDGNENADEENADNEETSETEAAEDEVSEEGAESADHPEANDAETADEEADDAKPAPAKPEKKPTEEDLWG